MGLWPVLGLMTAVALVLVVVPLLRRPAAVDGRAEHDLSVYRAQLRELVRDERNGLLGPEEAKAARLEIERRMLAADALSAGATGRALGNRQRWLLGAALALALPVFSLVVYSQLGRPELPAVPFASRADPTSSAEAGAGAAGGPGLPPVETMIARLEEQVAAAPDDREGWLRLGQAYALGARPAEAAEAYERAVALGGGAAEVQAALAEARIQAAGGVVTEPARDALQRALELEPANPRARFYQGLALLQRGERRPALEAWAALAGDAPLDAPYLPALRERITALATDLGLDPAAVLPEPGRGAASADAARGPRDERTDALQERPPAEQAEAIRGMVAGLAERLERAPDDVDGWRMLARSYRVLGDAAKAAEAAEQVALRRPDDAAAQIDYGEALLALQDLDTPLSPAVIEQWRKVVALDQGNPQALFLLGRAAAEAGDQARARELWQRLLERMPADAPQRAALQALLDQLGG